MELKRILIMVLIAFVALASAALEAEAAKGSILFDAGHAVDAGNADWVIGGAYSDFADLLRQHGFTVHETAEPLTAERLKGYQALVLPEPNSVFSTEEQQAIIQFIANGGGVFFIGDHIESDRNLDGIDSVGIFNQFVPALGFKMEDANVMEANLSAEPVSGEYTEHPVTYKVGQMAIWAGTSIRILDPTRVQGIVFFSEWLYGQPALAVGTHGKGRFVVIGDSAPFDDGSGTNPMENLHKGFMEYDHKQLALNVIHWLTNQPAEDL